MTDGDQHKVGLVWDGLQRTLCTDGVAVAEATQSAPQLLEVVSLRICPDRPAELDLAHAFT